MTSTGSAETVLSIFNSASAYMIYTQMDAHTFQTCKNICHAAVLPW